MATDDACPISRLEQTDESQCPVCRSVFTENEAAVQVGDYSLCFDCAELRTLPVDGMREFAARDIRPAIVYAMQGGQALHVWDGSTWPGKAPAVFRGFKMWAHLFDQDAARLMRTAYALGVRRIVVDGKRIERQHIDLCSEPLNRARALCIRAAGKLPGIE